MGENGQKRDLQLVYKTSNISNGTMEEVRKALASFLLGCGIIDGTFTGKIIVNIHQSGVTSITRQEYIR